MLLRIERNFIETVTHSTLLRIERDFIKTIQRIERQPVSVFMTNKTEKYVKKKDAEQLRRYTVSTRMNQSEIEQLDFLRGSQSRGNYIRTVFFGDNRLKVVPEINQQVYKHINQTTANLNQIAHHLNKHGIENSDVEEIRAALNEVKLQAIGLKLVSETAEKDDEDEPIELDDPHLNADF